MRHNLIVREPELYFDGIHQELDNFLRDTFVASGFAHPLNIIKNTTLRPALEVAQCKNNYKVRVQLPGVKKEDIELEADNDFMRICAEIKEEDTENDDEKHYHTSEFRYGKYQRTVSFEQPIKKDEIKAEYRDGILSITIPKQNTENTEPQKIEIE